MTKDVPNLGKRFEHSANVHGTAPRYGRGLSRGLHIRGRAVQADGFKTRIETAYEYDSSA